MIRPPMQQSIIVKLIQAEKKIKYLEQRIIELEEIIRELEKKKENIVCDSLSSDDIINEFDKQMRCVESFDLLEY